jgi:hypothetical protein
MALTTTSTKASRGVGRILAGLALITLCAVTARASDQVAVSGRVLDASSSKPIAGAIVAAAQGHATTDAEGRFTLALTRARHTIKISSQGYAAQQTQVDLTGSLVPELEVALVPARLFEERITVAATADAVAQTPATIPVRPSEVVAVAGGGENVFRVLQTLPGVTATDDFTSRLSVRGGGPDQNLTVMDGVEIHNPYRLFGLTSAFNPETVAGFELTAGAFSAKYGDRLSSLLVVENREGTTKRDLAGSAALSLTDTNGILEGRLPRNRGSWLLTGRRTYYDVVAERFTDSDLPSFDDVQGKLAINLFGQTRLTLFGLRSRETTDASFTGDDGTGALFNKTRNDLLTATLHVPLGTRGMARTIGALYETNDETAFDGRFRNTERRSNAPGDDAFADAAIDVTWAFRVRDDSLREELSFQLSEGHVLAAGGELHRLNTRVGFTMVGSRNESEANGSSLQGGVGLPDQLDSPRTDTRVGAWLTDRLRLGQRLELEGGLRLDRSAINERTELTPRFSATLSLNPVTRLRAAAGVHTQSPGYEKLLANDYFMDLSSSGPLDLDNERAVHALLSLERDAGAGVLVRCEAYLKRFSSLISGRLETPAETAARVAQYDFPAELATSVPNEPFILSYPENGTKGDAYGLDVYISKRATSPETRLTGWVSYTLGTARREAYGRRYPFDYDRRHALSVVAALRLKRGLDLSLTGKVASGLATTLPIGLRVAAVPDATDRDGDNNVTELIPERDASQLLVYQPDLGGIANLNGGRMPTYARLDARLTFTPRGGRSRWRLYADVINVLNRKNPGMVERKLEYDPTSDRPKLVMTREGSIPFLPSLGVHLTF